MALRRVAVVEGAEGLRPDDAVDRQPVGPLRAHHRVAGVRPELAVGSQREAALREELLERSDVVAGHADAQHPVTEVLGGSSNRHTTGRG